MIKQELRSYPFQHQLFLFNAVVPFFWMVMDASRGRLGANPAEALTRTSGVLAFVFLVLSLVVTPVAKRWRWSWAVRHRRLLGLASFFYALFHFITYIGFDRDWKFASVPADIAKRPFILAGMFCFFLMIPLAVTSTDKMIRRIGGKRWKRLHKLTYAIAIGAVVHWALIVKSDLTYPLLFGGAVAVLLLLRIRP